jgi:four helix bundle protein
LNLCEGAERRGGDRRRLFAYAHGSAAEVLGGLRIAATFGYVTDAQVSPAVELAGRVKAMTYRLAR